MKLKRELNEAEITEKMVKEVFEQELILTIKEDIEAGRLDENFLKHLKSAGKGIFDYYKILMTNYAKMLDQMVNQQLIPSAMGDKLEDKMDSLDEPEEIKGEEPGEQADTIGDLKTLVRQTADQVKKSGADDVAKKVDDMADAADAVEDAAEKKAGEGAEDEEAPAVSLKKVKQNKLKTALLQLGNKGLSGDKVGDMFDKAGQEIVKQAGPMASRVKKEDLPVIDAIKDQIVAILNGDLNALREQKIHPGTARFLAHFLDIGVENQNQQLIINNKVERE